MTHIDSYSPYLIKSMDHITCPANASNTMEFYSKNDTIFITGGTGFIGITIIEKVLRSLSQVKRIYVLLRVGTKSTLQGRYEKLLSSQVFDTLKNSFSCEQEFHDKIGSKIVPIEGDIGLDNLGISDSGLVRLCADTKVFIHCAASVSFDDPIEAAFNLNTLGSFRALTLAKDMKQLEYYVHVSTAFVLPKSISDRRSDTIHPFTFGDPLETFNKLKNMSRAEFPSFEKNVLKHYQNTYIFTKTLSEHIVQFHAREFDIPLVIVRPSIVTPALSEPVRGWAQGLSGLHIAMLLCGLGKVQEWPGNKGTYVDFVPVDVVSSWTLACATIANRRSTIPQIYNQSVNYHRLIMSDEFVMAVEQYWIHAPPPKRRSSSDIGCRIYPLDQYKRRCYFKYFIPFILSRLPGGKSLRKKLDTLLKIARIFYSFTSSEWLFENSKSLELNKTAPKELHVNVDNVYWFKYFRYSCMGVHEFILREPVDRSQEIRYNYKREHKLWK